jgi:alanine racemase
MNSTSTIWLSREALENNLQFMRGLFRPGVRLSSVVKGNAYGHGIREFVPMAESLGVDHFSVHSADEAAEVLQARTNNDTQIMIMGYLMNEDLEWAIEHEIAFFVFEMDRLEQAALFAKKLGKKAKVHIELETGMNRTGFGANELESLAKCLKENQAHLHFEGLCTHFAGAESIANYLRVQEQKEAFNDMAAKLEKLGLSPSMKHTCCSAAAIRLPDMHFDLVRIGILQYGFWPSRETFIEYLKGRQVKEDPLRRIISWKSRVMSTKEVEMGDYIGYGTTYLAQRDIRIAIIPIGYSHGFSRSLSNQGRVLVKGYRVPVVGMVNMNNTAIDVTEVPDVHKGEEVTLIGTDGALDISVSSFSELSDQLNYELLTRLPAKIPRKTL